MSQGYLLLALDPSGNPVRLEVDGSGRLYTTGGAGISTPEGGQGYLALALDPNGVPTPLSVDANGNLKVV